MDKLSELPEAFQESMGRDQQLANEQRLVSHVRNAEEHVVEETFRLLVENVVDCAIYSLDPSGRVTTWNAGARRMKGYEADEIIGQHFSVFFPPEDREKSKPQQELERALAEGRAEEEGWRLRKDGSRFWAKAVVTPLRDARGVLVGFAKVTRDLTEKRRAEEESRRLKEEQLRREIAEQARHVAESTAQTNARLQRLTAALSAVLSPERVAQEVLAEVADCARAQSAGLWMLEGKRIRLAAAFGFGADNETRFREIALDAEAPIADAIRTGVPIFLENRSEYAARYPKLEQSGRQGGDFAIACLPLGTSNQILGAVSFTYPDASEFDREGRGFLMAAARQFAVAVDRARLYEAEKKARIRSEFLAKASAALAQSLDYQKTLQTVAGFAVPGFADWVAADLIREDGAIDRVAIAAADATKVELGRELFRRFPPRWDDPVGVPYVLRTGKSEFVDEILDSLLVKYIKDPELLQIIRELQLKSSIIVPMRARGRSIGAMIFLMGKSARRYTAEDVALAEDLGIRAGVAVDNARLYRESLEASRLKDEFLSTLSHELRTPLTAILGWARILNDSGTSDSKQARAVEIIERNARSQAQLIEDMLDVSRIITGKMRLDVRLVNPVSSIEAAIDSVRPAAETKEVRIQMVLDPRAGPIMGDPDRLQQIVWNLLTNAIKFTPKRGRVLVQLARVNSHIEVEVSDSGEGIAPEFLPYVFEKFRQGDPSTKRPHGGLGLGLAIVRHLVELHGGSVAAKSEGLGKGASFRIILPLSPVHSEAAEPVREHPSAGGARLQLTSSSQLRGLRVLVVDDEQDARELLKEVLERHQAEVSCVGSASEAFSTLNQGDWDVLVSDLGMPGQDGYWLIKQVRNRSPAEGGLPAVAITAYARLEDRTNALRAGFDAHVAKPVDPVELVEVISAVLRRRRIAPGS